MGSLWSIQNWRISYMEAAINKESKRLNDEVAKQNRINSYSNIDIQMQKYINKLLLVIYAVLFLLLLLSLFLNREGSSLITSIIVAAFFLVYPFSMSFIGTNLTNMFVSLKNTFYKGNALIMYKPSTQATY